MGQRLTTKERWEDFWEGVRIPLINTPDADLRKQFETFLPRDHAMTFCEVGCAPGGWLAWFHKAFGYHVSGIEYAEQAAEVTKRNLELLEVPGMIEVEDFFSDGVLAQRYDIVFSSGFIEHFTEIGPVVNRHCLLSNEFVILIVPNLFGINGSISKIMRPKVYAEHNPIDVEKLKTFCEEAGLQTLFCDYVGGVSLIMPAAQTPFFKSHPLISKVLNLPIRVFNRVASTLSRLLGFTSRTKWFSKSLLFVGKKNTK